MKFTLTQNNALCQCADCLLFPIFSDVQQSEIITQFNQKSQNQLADLFESKEFSGNSDQVIPLFKVENISANKVILIGMGKRSEKIISNVIHLAKVTAEQLIAINNKEIAIILDDIVTDNAYHVIRSFIENIYQISYQFDEFKTKKSPIIQTEKINFILSNPALLPEAELAIKHGIAIAKGVIATRTIANQPPNICNAQYLANKAQELSQQFEFINTDIYDEKALTELNMNAYLAVGQASVNESIMTVINYKGAEDSKEPIVFVGKGLTFDSGGISIKPSADMDEMKYDMCGAATVFGLMKAVAELKLPINVVGVMAGCENMPGTGAYRPGDILTTKSGKTVEVINTDAEGRLVLCDVLTFVEKFNPKAVIDIATLTGACIIALGHHYTGVMGNNEQLIQDLISASNQANDKAWQLPLDDDFQSQIKSTCADIVNAAGRDGGTITAGCFLSQFTQNYTWAHLDIAGTAWTSGSKKGATGRPVSMLVQYLLNLIK